VAKSADVDEEFVDAVSAKLAELSAEKPTVSEGEIAHALGLGDGSLAPDRLEEALDELGAASVAVLVGQNATNGRMWRHSGMDAEEARALLTQQAEAERREAARAEELVEEEARERAEEIMREREAEEGEPGDDEAGDVPDAPARRDSITTTGGMQRVELPMTVVGALSREAVAEIVQVGVDAAKADGEGFEFVVTP
jgi:hypothetical protein